VDSAVGSRPGGNGGAVVVGSMAIRAAREARARARALERQLQQAEKVGVWLLCFFYLSPMLVKIREARTRALAL
jgi:hypothetical protein